MIQLGETLASRDWGPSGARRAALCFLCVAASSWAAGCAPPAAPLPVAPPGSPPVVDDERLARNEAAFARPGRAADSIAAATMRAAGLTAPFERRYVLDPAAGPIVAGIIPGGHPVFRDSLITVVALGPRAAAAALEAARWVAERAAYEAGPARSLLVALPRTAAGQSSTTSVVRVLAVPLWDASRVAGLLVVGPDAGAVSGAAAERRLSLTPIEPGPGESASALALRVYEAMNSAARIWARPVPTRRDTN